MTQELGNPLVLSGVQSGETDSTWMSFVKKGKGVTSHRRFTLSKDSLKAGPFNKVLARRINTCQNRASSLKQEASYFFGQPCGHNLCHHIIKHFNRPSGYLSTQ